MTVAFGQSLEQIIRVLETCLSGYLAEMGQSSDIVHNMQDLTHKEPYQMARNQHVGG